MKTYILILTIVVALVPAVNATIGQVWNSSDDFHTGAPQDAGNPLNDWLYGFKWEGQGDGITTPLHLFTGVDAGGSLPWYHYWADWDGIMPASGGYDHKNMSANVEEVYGAHWEPWQTTMWPGNNDGTLPAFRWVAPEDGTYDLDVLFTGNKVGGQYSFWLRTWVVSNVGGVSTVLDQGYLYDGYYVSGAVPGSYVDFSNLSMLLSAGDSIDFLVDDGDSGTGAAVGLDATITQVIPEPASMILLGLGSLVLARRRK